MPKMITILPSGITTQVELDRQPTLEELQHGVGGYIEHINLTFQHEAVHGYVNEDGKRLQLPVNPKATAIFHNLKTDAVHYNDLELDPQDYIHPYLDQIRGAMVIWTGEVS